MSRSNNLWLHSRLMVTESYDAREVEKTMMYYSTPLTKESDFPFNFYLLDLPQNYTGFWVKQLVDLWMANMPREKWANWVVSVQSCSSTWCSLGSSSKQKVNSQDSVNHFILLHFSSTVHCSYRCSPPR